MLRRLRVTAAAIATGIARTLLTRREASVQLVPGDRAPAFELKGSDGRLHRLADHVGRSAVVLAWFPKAFTGGCTAECRSLTSSGDVLRRFDVKYFAASVDDPDTNTEFAASLGVDYPILSDPDGTVARAYGVMAASGFPHRWTFFIGVDGRVLAIDTQVSAASHGTAIADRLRALGVRERL